VSLDPSDEDFWRFSWHEIGTEDVAAFIDYILGTTNQSAVHYVGHSQGCTTLVVLLSMRPEYNQFVKTAILLGPPVFMGHTHAGTNFSQDAHNVYARLRIYVPQPDFE